MSNSTARPFYHQFAWAYDLIIDAPVEKRCHFIEETLRSRVPKGRRVLDAGCGTGSYTIALARLGYETVGIDISPELIDIAKQKAFGTGLSASFIEKEIFDLAAEPLSGFHAVLCRGVLNDVLDDPDRKAVFHSLASALTDGGILILDVRDWETTRRRVSREPLFRKSVETSRGNLTFTSLSRLDPAKSLLLLKERHFLTGGGETIVAEHDFAMRCWTPEELHLNLEAVSFHDIIYLGDYDTTVPVGTTDRIVVAATLKRFTRREEQ